MDEGAATIERMARKSASSSRVAKLDHRQMTAALDVPDDELESTACPSAKRPYGITFGRLVSEGTLPFGTVFEPSPEPTLIQFVRTEYQYDSLGRLEFASLPHLPGTTSQGLVAYRYDPFHRLSRETYPDGSQVNYFYPNRETSTNDDWFTDPAAATGVVVQKPEGNFEAVILDPYDNPVASIQGGEGTVSTRYVYGGFDLLKAINAPRGTTEILRDQLGRKIDLRDPALGLQHTTHNGFDEPDTETDANDKVRRCSYDRLGRLIELHDGDGALLAKWLYGGAGPNELGRLVGSYRQAKPGAARLWRRLRRCGRREADRCHCRRRNGRKHEPPTLRDDHLAS